MGAHGIKATVPNVIAHNWPVSPNPAAAKPTPSPADDDRLGDEPGVHQIPLLAGLQDRSERHDGDRQTPRRIAGAAR